MADQLIGKTINNRYEILAEIGRGGYSTVYKASDLSLNQIVAVKCFYPPPGAFEKIKEKVKREMQTIRKLRHQFVIQLFDFFEEDNWLFLVMEFIDGGSLSDFVKEKGALNPVLVKKIMEQMAEALAIAHQNGIIHRDIKPQNILFRKTGDAVLADFGSAKVYGQNTSSMTISMTGTLDYMSPEVIQNNPYDCRTDIYSLGLTMYYALTGRKAIQSSLNQLSSEIENGFDPKLIEPKADSFLSKIIKKSTAFYAANRFLTAQTLLDFLKAPTALSNEQNEEKYCFICGNENALPSGSCLGCLVSQETEKESTSLLFIRNGLEISSSDFVQKFFTPTSLSMTKINECKEGLLPFVRVNSELHDKIEIDLLNTGIVTEVVTPKIFFGAAPKNMSLFLIGNLVLGTWVGLQYSPHFLWVTIAFFLFSLFYLRSESVKPIFQNTNHPGKLNITLIDSMLSTYKSLIHDNYRKNVVNLFRTSHRLWNQIHSQEVKLQIESTLFCLLKSILEIDSTFEKLRQIYQKDLDVHSNFLFNNEASFNQLSFAILKAESLLMNLQLSTQTVDDTLILKRVVDSMQDLETEYRLHIEAKKELDDLLNNVA